MDTEIRTLGDGMDNALIKGLGATGVAILKSPKVVISNNLPPDILQSLRPVEPKSRVFYLVPRYVPKERNVPKYLIKKPKEPKFVPYEPYKAAVQPIISNKPVHKQIIEIKPSNNNIEIHELVNQMSEMRKLELSKSKENIVDTNSDNSHELRLQWEKEKDAYETDIKNLRETNSHLENQLKFQAQVNSELKTLLVAAVGEDLESRVQHLTEDKLSLARALLKSANHLTSHQEQTEWLSGQCEVWRSKFLASSLMVEELAKWKSALTARINDLQGVLKTILEERRKVHSQSLRTYNSLNLITENLTDDKKKIDLKYGNIVELVNVNQELSEFVLRTLNLQDEAQATQTLILNKYTYTVVERAALKLLQNPVTKVDKQDALLNAVMGAATSLGGKQMFLQHPSMHKCCSHCKGDVLNI